MNSILYIVCGLPFSGKSSLAKAMAGAVNQLVHIEVDDFYDNTEELEEEAWTEAFEQAYAETQSLLEQGKSVVFDATNFLIKERNKLRAIAQDSGAESQVILVQVDREQALARLRVNRQNKRRKDVSASDWQEVSSQFELPQKEEAALVFQQSDDVSDWIAKNITSLDKP